VQLIESGVMPLLHAINLHQLQRHTQWTMLQRSSNHNITYSSTDALERERASQLDLKMTQIIADLAVNSKQGSSVFVCGCMLASSLLLNVFFAMKGDECGYAMVREDVLDLVQTVMQRYSRNIHERISDRQDIFCHIARAIANLSATGTLLLVALGSVSLVCE
jgi:hypothetical protein